MKTAAIIIPILLAAALIVFVWTRSKRPEIKSFWDVVRNPNAMSDLDQFHKEVKEKAVSLSGSPAEIAPMVDYFVFEAPSSDDAWTELRILAKLGTKSYPRALEILRDFSLRDRLTVMTEYEHSVPEGPINRLCEIFDQEAPPPPEAAKLLSPFLQLDHKQIRKDAALIIGSIGSANSLPDLRQALKDDDEYVKSFALMGIERAISGGRIHPSSNGEFFALVAGMWPGDTDFAVCDSIPQILLRLDRDRAVKRLLGEDLFTVHFGPLWRILEAFNEESVEISRSRLLAIVADANKEPIEYPMDNVLEQALPLLATHREEEDLAMFERCLAHENEDVSRGATEALYRFHRYSDLIRDPWEVVEKSGWDALTAAEKHICAIEQLDAEVRNGGFAQYYFNSSGDHWLDAQNGLAAVGAKRRHRLMLATVERFGDTGPAVERDTRTSQLSKLVRKARELFREQDSTWFKIEDENLDRLRLEYNLANLEGRHKAE